MRQLQKHGRGQFLFSVLSTVLSYSLLRVDVNVVRLSDLHFIITVENLIFLKTLIENFF